LNTVLNKHLRITLWKATAVTGHCISGSLTLIFHSRGQNSIQGNSIKVAVPVGRVVVE